MPNAPISISASGQTALVAAPAATSKIRVWSFDFVSNGTVNLKFQSASNDLTGAYPLIASGGMVRASGTFPIWDCNLGEALNVNLDASVGIFGSLQYEILRGS